VRQAVRLLREHVRWDIDGGGSYFEGETEACVNGVVLSNAAYFGEPGEIVLAKLLAGQLADGGWNCWDDRGATVSSLHSTICVLEGLWAWERAGGGTDDVRRARIAGEEYLLDRHLFRRRSTGEVIDPRFTMTSYPVRWYYDVLRALDHLRQTRPEGDDRCVEALALLRSKRRPDGSWVLENTHEGPTPFAMEGEFEGFPSRWVTLRALRVLRWAGDPIG
jgi:hypothetical protein